MTMEFCNCDESLMSISTSVTADAGPDCMLDCTLQQTNSAQSLAASSCSTSTCTDFSSSEGGFDESPSEAAVTVTGVVSAAVDTSVSLLSLDFDGKLVRGSQLSAMKACSALSLIPQQQLQQHSSLGPGHRSHHHQQQKQRRRSNAISAKSRSSYLAQYNETKCAYFDGVLAGDIPVRRAGMTPRFS